MLAMEIKIAGLEEIARRQKIALDAHREQIEYHDEAIEAQGEDFNRIQGYTNARIESLENADIRLRLEQLERTKDVQSDVSNRQAAVITALQKEVAALRDSQKSNLVMEEKRPVGRSRSKVPK
jgi:hypothetical protein